jgi:tetratricopeptide (TPR) repeat protein
VSPRTGPAAAAAAAFAALAPAAAAAEDPAAAAQAARAEELMDRLYAGHGDPDAAPEREALLRQARVLVAECLEAGNYRTAEFVAGQIASHHPDLLEAEHRYASILIARGERERAEKDLREHLKARPSDCSGYGLLAGLLETQGRVRDAMDVHEAHLREHANEAGPLHSRAWMALWGLRDVALARGETARMRRAAGEPGVPAATARFLRENADLLDEQAKRMESDRAALGDAEARVDRLLWGGIAGSVLLLAAAGWLTRTR